MPAYVEGAARIDYPPELVHVTADNLTDALREIGGLRARTCLQRRVAKGAFLTSPLHAGLEMITAVCEVARAAGIELRLDAARAGRDQLMTRGLIKSYR